MHNALGFRRAKKFLASRKNKLPVVQVSFVRNEPSTKEFCSQLIASETLDGFDALRIYEEHSQEGVFGKSEISVGQTRQFCPKLEHTLVIAHDGTISRCNYLWNTEEAFDAGTMSISEIWHSAQFKRLREDYPDAQCAPCSQWIGHTLGESYIVKDGKQEHAVFAPSVA